MASSVDPERSKTDMITLTQEDLTTLEVDAIINAANTSLLGGGGVDGAIHRRAGPELLEACRKLGGCETGQVKMTRGYELPAKYIFHAVGPIWKGGHENEADLLKSCYLEALKLAVDLDVQSLAFPAISCGVYAFPINEACRLAHEVLQEAQKRSPRLKKILLVCFDPKVLKAYQELGLKLSQP